MNILVPVDFSDVTREVLSQAESMARSFHAHVYLLHVVAPDPDFVGYDVGPEYIRETLAKKFHAEHREIQKLGKDLEAAAIRSTALLVQGPTEQMILDEADKLNANLIIMGSHGHGALYNMILGSVSEGVLKKAPCPILFVPAR